MALLIESAWEDEIQMGVMKCRKLGWQMAMVIQVQAAPE
jgi:hypothetical protein